MRYVLLLLAAVLACTAQAQGRVYKWVDADGKVRYTDQPPESASLKPQELKVPDAPPVPPPGPARVNPSPREQALRQQADLQKMQKEMQDRERRAVNVTRCAEARQRMASLDSGKRLYRVDPQGTRNYMDDADLANQREVQSQAIATYCNN